MFGSAIIKRKKSTGKLYISQEYNKISFDIRDMDDNQLYGTTTMNLYALNKTYVAREKSRDVANELRKRNIKSIDVIINGFGIEPLAILAPITSMGIAINKIKNITPIENDGHRWPKRKKKY